MVSNIQRTIALGGVVALVTGAAILLYASASSAEGIACCTVFDCPCDRNPSTGNPHPGAGTGTSELGNPHGQGELGNPHGQGELGNPHGQGEVEVGNPHIANQVTGSCSGNPHGQVGGTAPCPGSR